ncbi:hypothetical protein PAMP_023877 [Pampus punctatissimus]
MRNQWHVSAGSVDWQITLRGLHVPVGTEGIAHKAIHLRRHAALWITSSKLTNAPEQSETNCTESRRTQPYQEPEASSPITVHQCHSETQTEELKRRALSIPKHISVHKSAMESGRSLIRGEPVSSRQCGWICVSPRKASDRERLHHPDTTNTSS